MKLKFLALISLLIVLANNVTAASMVNTHVRILEDVLWVVCFLVIIFFSIQSFIIATSKEKPAYILFLLTGISGLIWKSLGLLKRIFIVSEPKWLFDITRETFEGATGLIMAFAFVALVYSIFEKHGSDTKPKYAWKKLFNKK